MCRCLELTVVLEKYEGGHHLYMGTFCLGERYRLRDILTLRAIIGTLTRPRTNKASDAADMRFGVFPTRVGSIPTRYVRCLDMLTRVVISRSESSIRTVNHPGQVGGIDAMIILTNSRSSPGSSCSAIVADMFHKARSTSNLKFKV